MRPRVRPLRSMIALCVLASCLAVRGRARGEDATELSSSRAPGSPGAIYRPPPSAHEAAPPRELRVEHRAGAEVVVVPIAGTIDPGLAAFVRRAIDEHPGAAAIVLDVNTFGGRVDAAVEIRDALLDAHVPTVAFVHPRAISAGALISLACDRVVISPGGSIGAATPWAEDEDGDAEVEEKMVSYMRTEMRATAEAKGRRGDVAEAMVDRDVAIEGVIEAGKLLTLDTDRAIALRVADARAATLDEALRLLELADAPTVAKHENWGEKTARVLTEPTVAGLLLSVGMLAVLATLYTAHFGVLSAVGLLCLGLFFGGHGAVHLVGWGEAAAFVLGLVLLGVELFVTPGFGLPGIAGIALVIGSITLALLSSPLDVSWDTGLLTEAVARVATSLLGTGVLGALFVRFLPDTPVGRRLVLSTRATRDAGYVANQEPSPEAVGAEGETVTAMRPSGKVRIGDRRYDAISEREYLAPGQRVRVVRVSGAELVVRPLSAEEELPS